MIKRFIQREREKYIYYAKELNLDGEKIGQLRIEFKVESMDEDRQKELKLMKDGDRIDVT